MIENKEKHPSYATLSFSRCSASESKALFGSSIKHRDTIRMRINRAEIVRNLGRDWIYGNGVIAEVEMSYSQFAEAITAMNVGEGVPVTLRYLSGEEIIEECPFVDKRTQFENEFSEQLKENNTGIDTLINEVVKLFDEKKSFNKADRESIISKLGKIKMDIGCNAEFAFTSFNEQMDKTTMEAKGEVEAFVQNKISSLAQCALVEHSEEIKALQCPIDID